MELKGVSLIAGKHATANGTEFRAVNPQTGESIEPQFRSSSAADVDAAAQAAQQAFATYGQLSGRERARFLRSIADGIDAASAELAERGQLETALPQPRLQGEIKRAANQFRLFAEVIEEGSWVVARIDTALPDRQPLPAGHPLHAPPHRPGRGLRREQFPHRLFCRWRRHRLRARRRKSRHRQGPSGPSRHQRNLGARHRRERAGVRPPRRSLLAALRLRYQVGKALVQHPQSAPWASPAR